MKKFSQILNRQRVNAVNPAALWRRGMTILNANGDVDMNTAGYQYAVLTTQQIRAKVITQKYFEIPPADYMPVVPGTGAWMEGLITNYSFDIAGPFATGIQGVAAQSGARVAQVDAAIASKSTPIITWAKGYQYSYIEVEKATATGNWSPITARLEALKRHYDLGLQFVSFLGMPEVGITGLLNNADVTVDTSTITANISTMTGTQFRDFVATILGVYRSNSNRTAMPNRFTIPESDFLGLAAPVNPDFAMISKKEYLEKAFQEICGSDFRVMKCAYADKDLNAGIIDAGGEYQYTLYRDDADCIQMDVPVPFLLRPPATPNNYMYEGVGVSQFGPLVVFRPRTMMYFRHA